MKRIYIPLLIALTFTSCQDAAIEPTSCMHNNIPYYNAISREAMVKRIMEYAGEEYSFEDFKANDKEALPSVTTKSDWMWSEGSGASSRFDQMPPKFMGDKPSFKK